MRSITLCPAGPRKPTRSVRTGAPIAGCRWRQSNGAAAALTGRVFQPSGISLRASIRPLESAVTVSGSRFTGGLDLRRDGAVRGARWGGTVGTVAVALTDVDIVGEVVVLAITGSGAIVVDVAVLSSREVADAAPLGVMVVNVPATATAVIITAETTDRR